MKNKKVLLTILALVVILSSLSAFALDLPPGVLKIIEYQKELALSVTFLIAFIGGIITFSSPCGFVVIPTFFSYVFKERKRALFMTAFFALGMTTAFMIFGVIAGLVGNFFNIYKEFFAMLSGLMLITFGVLFALGKGFSFVEFKMKDKPRDAWGTFVHGFFFAIGWSPCVGPILAGMILLAAKLGSVFKSALLFVAYALGVSVPLLFVAFLSDRFDVAKYFTSKQVTFSIFGKKIYTHVYGIVGGLLLIGIGLIMLFEKGTSIFMETIPQYVPWTMEGFTRMNEALVESGTLNGSWANVVGGIAIIGMIALLIFLIVRRQNAQ